MNRYAISDLHGQLDLYNQIKEYINDDDILYVLGDCNDRGPYPWTTLRSVLDDEQCCLLMGNHEYMLWRAADYVLNTLGGGIKRLLTDDTLVYSLGGRNNPIRMLYYNGGYDTLKQWALEPEHLKYLIKIKELPIDIELTSKNGNRIYLSHAGFNPGDKEETVEERVWDRYHYLRECNDFQKGDVLVHGHTPCQHLIRDLELRLYGNDYIITNEGDGCCIYNQGFKYDIDLGAHYTGRTCLLNLDTLETKIFQTEIEDEY